MRATRIGAAFALVLATSGPAGAQDFEPSPLEGADVTVVPRAELDAALPARSACREPVEVLNEDGLRWGRVRAGTLELDAFRRQVENADYAWGEARGRCGNARKDIEETLLTRRVLDHDARRLDRLRRAMSAVETAWIEQADVEDVNAALATYRIQAQEYAAWTEAAAEFWQGAWLRSPGRSGCIDDLDREVREAAVQVRRQVVRPEGERDDQALMDLATRLSSVDTARSKCRPEERGDRMQLELLGRLLQAYRDAVEGLAAGDDVRVRGALQAEQTATQRRARCAAEHANGTPSTLCRAPEETPDE